MGETAEADVVIVGGGIAGASLAYFLGAAGAGRVVLLEREAQPGMHATGRSAAVLVEWDPVPAVQALTVLGARFLREPPPGFADHPLLDPVGVIATFEEPVWSAVREGLPQLVQPDVPFEVLDADAVLARVPVLAREHVAGAVCLPGDGHIDVHALLWGYLRHAARAGVERRWGVSVTGIRVRGGRCRGVETTAGPVGARWVVNAAGAWAGEIGRLAGAMPVPLVPCRRTAVTFAAPAGLDARRWPFVSNETQQLYFKPEAGGFMASPMDEEPMAPCDAQPDELVVAETLERVARVAPPLAPRRPGRAWAGLRTFAPDRVPVVGEDPRLPGFFWLAGQGGCGIETSPALGRIAADLLLTGRTALFDAAALAPARFA